MRANFTSVRFYELRRAPGASSCCREKACGTSFRACRCKAHYLVRARHKRGCSGVVISRRGHLVRGDAFTTALLSFPSPRLLHSRISTLSTESLVKSRATDFYTFRRTRRATIICERAALSDQIREGGPFINRSGAASSSFRLLRSIPSYSCTRRGVVLYYSGILLAF